MLHISSARLHHQQATVFALLEDTPGSVEPLLVEVFLFQCCATFLDARTLLKDMNKLALGARALCFLVLFVRRVMLHGLAASLTASDGCSSVGAPQCSAVAADSAAGHAGSDEPTPEARLGALIATMPRLLRAVVGIACDGSPAGAPAQGLPRAAAALQSTGLWKLAVETLVYLVEDTLPALERNTVVPRVAAAYWEAVIGSLDAVVARTLPLQRTAVAQATASPELLSHAVANLVVHKLLPSPATPRQARERLVQLLGDLVGFPASAGRYPDALLAAEDIVHVASALGHFFDLCTIPETERSTTTFCEESAAALAARWAARAAASRVAGSNVAEVDLRPPVRLPDRAVVLGLAVPVLLAQVRAVLAAYANEDADSPDSPADTVPASAPASASPTGISRASAVRSVLGHLKAFRADKAANTALEPVLPTDRARSACRLAGSQSFIVALLPQVAALAGTSDRRVARDIREVLAGLVSELGL